LGTAFYRSFPYLILLVALGILAMVGLWARVAASNSAGAAPASGTVAPTSAEVMVGDFTIMPATIQIPAGRAAVLHVMNHGPSPHILAVQTPGGIVQTGQISADTTADLNLPALKAGRYDVWCPIAGHRELGMAATLVVGSRSATGTTGMPGMGSGSGQIGDGMTAEQMAQAHKQSTLAFPAATAGVGGQVLTPTVVDGVKVFHLTAKQVQWEVSPGQIVTAFTYNGGVPGPEIRVHRDDRVRIVLDNELPQPTTIHFHGVTVPNRDDGVPYITQDPIMPGQTFTYAFRVVDPPGTYMYHAHFNSTEQVGRGLYGAFVVEPRHPTWDQAYTVILGDGPLGYTLDGKSFPATSPLTAHLGDTVLIRLSNMGNILHPMHLHGYHFEVVAQDGFPLAQPFNADTLVVAPGETYDMLVYATHPGVWAFHCHILSHVEGPQGMFGMVTALVVK
jgi:FtsP/CotA-like multicopper oxidase with cupredoxin domain/plastocyanin